MNFLMRQIIYAMFTDIRTVLRDLGQIKLDHYLEEFKGLKEEIPESGLHDGEEEGDISSLYTTSTCSKAEQSKSWFARKDWKRLSTIQQRKRHDMNKLARTDTWMEGTQVDSRDYYENIPHVSLQVIISELDKVSSFGSIEELIRHNSNKSGGESEEHQPKKTISREEGRHQLERL